MVLVDVDSFRDQILVHRGSMSGYCWRLPSAVDLSLVTSVLAFSDLCTDASTNNAVPFPLLQHHNSTPKSTKRHQKHYSYHQRCLHCNHEDIFASGSHFF